MTFINRRLLLSVRTKLLGILMCVFTAALLSNSALAGETASKIDPSASVARLYSGPDSAGGVPARVVGTVKLDSDHPDQSKVEVCIYPADEDWGHSLTPSGSLPSGYVPDATDHTLLAFKSTRVVKAEDGQLRVEGNLALTRVERSVTVASSAGGEGYFGAEQDEPVLRTVTREVAFIFASPRSTPQSSSLISASAVILSSDFYDLPNAITETNWPTVGTNQTCDIPTNIGLGYTGAKCTGTELGTTRSTEDCQLAAPLGEGYTGPACNSPATYQTTIVLQLELTDTNVRP